MTAPLTVVRPDPPTHVKKVYLRTQPKGRPYDWSLEAPWPEPKK